MDKPSSLEILRSHHRKVLADLADVDACLASPPLAPGTADNIRAALRQLVWEMDGHMRVEEHVLFPALIACAPSSRETVAILLDEHEDLRRILHSLLRGLSEPAVDSSGSSSVLWSDFHTLLREHIRKEEGAVFLLAERMLRPQDWRDVEEGIRRFHPGAAGTESEESK